MKSYEVFMNISIEDAVVVEAENEEEARKMAYPCGHSGVYHWYITEVIDLEENNPHGGKHED